MPGETLLWQGRPKFRIEIDSKAMRLSLPALAGVTFFAFQHYSSPFGAVFDAEYIPGLSNELSVPLVVVSIVLYLVLYNLRHGMVHPGLTRYALTNRRAMVANKLPYPNVKTYRLTPMTPVNWLGDDPGTVTFSEDLVHYNHNAIQSRHVGFHNIPDAGRVHALIQKAKESEG